MYLCTHSCVVCLQSVAVDEPTSAPCINPFLAETLDEPGTVLSPIMDFLRLTYTVRYPHYVHLSIGPHKCFLSFGHHCKYFRIYSTPNELMSRISDELPRRCCPVRKLRLVQECPPLSYVTERLEKIVMYIEGDQAQ